MTVSARRQKIYSLEFVVRLGLELEFVKKIYIAYPDAIEDSNYAVIFHSLYHVNRRNTTSSYEDVILFLLDEVKKTGVNKFQSINEPWNGSNPLSIEIRQEDNRTAEVIDAILEIFLGAITTELLGVALKNGYNKNLVLKMLNIYFENHKVDLQAFKAWTCFFLMEILSKQNFSD